MECPRCGHSTPDGEMSCSFCKALLISVPAEEEIVTSIGPSYKSYGPSNPFVLELGRARRFLLIALVWGALLVTPVLAAALGSSQLMRSLRTDPDMASTVQGGLFLIVTLGVVYLAFLIAKTGQAIGLKFWQNFLLALVPPLWPAVWARTGGRNMLLPYAYLLFDAIVLSGARTVDAETGWIFTAAVLVMTPFIIYHFFGCALADLGTTLGYNRYLAVLWFCALPYALLIAMMISMGSEQTWYLILSAEDSASAWIMCQMWMDTPGIKAMLILWPVLTFLLWLKAIYESLSFPLFD